MKVVSLSLLLIFLSVPADQDVFNSLRNLEGTWKMDTPRGRLFERWAVVGDHELKGTSFKVSNSDTIILENIQLLRKQNDIFYIPSVQDQNDKKPIPFRLVSATSKRFVFENPAHDYPQRIIYTLINTDSITARIEGTKAGIQKSSDFYYGRERR